jgi:hypothetical protein
VLASPSPQLGTLDVNIPIEFEFGGLESLFSDIELKLVVTFHEDQLFVNGITLDAFSVDFDLAGVLNAFLPPPGAVLTGTEDYLLVCGARDGSSIMAWASRNCR